MKFNSKLDARKYMESRNCIYSEYNDEEKEALLEFFSEQELIDKVFISWNFTDCLRDDVNSPSCRPHIDVK